MKIVYLGTDAYLSCFLKLSKQCEILALYTCLGPEDFFRNLQTVEYAKAHDIPVYEHTITADEEREWIAKGCRLFVSADYGRKIPVLTEKEGFFGINIHQSLLPEGRSYCPVECAMEKGLRRTGVTIHKLSDKLDRGDILLQENVEILEQEDSVDIYLKCENTAMDMLTQLAQGFKEIWGNAKPQKELLPYWSIEHIEDARFTHELSMAEAKRRYRIYNRMVRVRIAGEVYFVKSIYSSHTPIAADVIDLGDICLYRLADGHLRLGLIAASDPAVWEAKSYPFRKSGREA